MKLASGNEALKAQCPLHALVVQREGTVDRQLPRIHFAAEASYAGDGLDLVWLQWLGQHSRLKARVHGVLRSRQPLCAGMLPIG